MWCLSVFYYGDESQTALAREGGLEKWVAVDLTGDTDLGGRHTPGTCHCANDSLGSWEATLAVKPEGATAQGSLSHRAMCI